MNYKYSKGDLPCCGDCKEKECFKGQYCIDFAIHNGLIKNED